MRIVLFLLAAVATAWSFSSCKSGSGSALFCDTVCLNDTLMFRNENHPMKPYVYISVANCGPDTIGRGYIGDGGARKLAFSALIPEGSVKLNPSKITGYAGDTSNSYLLFNDCITGRGYSIKLPYGPNGSLKLLSSAINNHDPKFSVEEGLFVSSDRGNLFVEDMNTGKVGQITFGQIVELNYDKVHELLDSVNITRNRFYARVKIGDEWKELVKEKVEFK